MNIIMLAAGTSSRMGNINKMLLDYNGLPMVTHCCLKALEFLEEYSLQTNTKSRLVVVTGYRRQSTEKALNACKQFIEQTKGLLDMVVINNPNYQKGQFTSAKTGLAQILENQPFFISLADMPLISANHYKALVPLLKDYDAVRPFYNKEPGHPVLHSYSIKETVLSKADDFAMNKLMKNIKVLEKDFDDSSWTFDVDNPQNYLSLIQ